jgi:hypothetical protein
VVYENKRVGLGSHNWYTDRHPCQFSITVVDPSSILLLLFGYYYQSLSMYPREITTTSVWIRHHLPLSPPPPLNRDEKLRKKIRSQNVKSTDEMIEQYVLQERARLDLKWCLDEYFGWNVSDPFLGQLVTANLSGLVHLVYIINITPVNVTVTPVDMHGNSVVIGFDDIYSAEHGPFYEKFLLNNHLFHPQHVLDHIENQKRQDELIRFNHNVSFDMTMVESTCEHSEIDWPEGKEMWLFHDELPQRTQFVKCKQQIMLTTSVFNIVDHSMQQKSTACDCVASSCTSQYNKIILLIQQIMAKQDILLEKNKLLNEELARQTITINKLSLTVETIARTRMWNEDTPSHKL